jgi:hypothetical protein
VLVQAFLPKSSIEAFHQCVVSRRTAWGEVQLHAILVSPAIHYLPGERASVMSDLLGITSNGFNYTAQYDAAALGSVMWAATFRKSGIYRGMRHGRVFDVSTLSQPEVKLAVMDDIEETWVNEH